VSADSGDQDGAIAVYHDALRLAREVRQPDDEAIALQGLGEAHLRQDKPEDGTARLREALEIYRRLGMPAADQVIARLAGIGACLSGSRSQRCPRIRCSALVPGPFGEPAPMAAVTVHFPGSRRL
jgi:hypothetical protein